MLLYNKILLLPLVILVALSSCKKEDERYSTTPEIEFISLTPSSTSEFAQNVTLVISYKDGDGDIGTEDPDSYSLFIKDKRLPNSDKYHVQPLSPPESSIQIEGELSVKIAGLFVLGSGNSETTNFTVTLKDRAGNISNEVVTSNITITK